MLDGAVLEGLASALELSVGGKGACRTGIFLRVSRRPQNHLSGEKECVGRGWLRRPRNYPSVAKDRVGRGWLRLWGVAGAPFVDRSPKVDAPSSPELTVGADGDAVDWNAPRSVTYGRRGEYNYRLP